MPFKVSTVGEIPQLFCQLDVLTTPTRLGDDYECWREKARFKILKNLNYLKYIYQF